MPDDEIRKKELLADMQIIAHRLDELSAFLKAHVEKLKYYHGVE